MDKIKWVPIIDDIYKQNFHLCYGGDSEEFIRFLEYNKDIEITDDDKDVLMGSKGCVYANGTYFYL